MGRTSTEVKHRWNKQNYKAVTVYLPQDLAKQFKDKAETSGISQRQVIITAVEEFLRDK